MNIFGRKKPPLFIQHDAMDCAPTCLRMICAFYGKDISLQALRDLTNISRDGVSVFHLKKAALELGFNAVGIQTSPEQLPADSILPCILHWDGNHYVVLYKISKNYFYVADPAIGYIRYKREDFVRLWRTHGPNGIAFLLEPGPDFSKRTSVASAEQRSFRTIWAYFRAHRSLFYQLLTGLLVTSLIQVLFPLLTQSIVDKGINGKNIHFVLLIAIGQFMLIAGRMSLDFLRSWVLLHISVRVNVSLLSDFLKKLMKLNLAFFDTKNTGDIFQRIGDHKRIEEFLTVTTLNTLFSLFTFLVFSGVLLAYNPKLFLVFIIATVLYVGWTLLFLKKRKELDYQRFGVSARNQNVLLQIIEGMPEIKLNNAEQKKRGDWETIQAELFRLNTKTLFLGQAQQSGGFFINEIKNVIILCLAALSVIKGEMTLGFMMAIQYIIGQLNSPVNQFIGLIQVIQDARISMDRINEIYTFKDESDPEKQYVSDFEAGDIAVENVCFAYPGVGDRNALEDISLTIEKGKTTAIVGTSGSGKTTLLKLLLKFYEADSGEIRVRDIALPDISAEHWRSSCGAVMQDGYIFSDTIAGNICPGIFEPDMERVRYALEMANLTDFISKLPAGMETKIGLEGNGISQGQKQRILIARSIYKDPDYIFFDEATNALDASNESKILANLQEFCRNKTVIVVAHRLSTVRHADKIIVMENGRIVEEGSHFELTELRGKYFELVKNQLELAEN